MYLNYFKLVEKILGYCSSLDNVRYVKYRQNVNDMNSDRNIDYDAMVLCPQNHTEDENQNGYLGVFNFLLYYQDRIDENTDNILEIQSKAIDNLHMVLVSLKEDNDIISVYNASYNMRFFRNSDNLAGAVMTFSVSIYLEQCL